MSLVSSLMSVRSSTREQEDRRLVLAFYANAAVTQHHQIRSISSRRRKTGKIAQCTMVLTNSMQCVYCRRLLITDGDPVV